MSLEFRHIAHAYGQVRALEDISFSAPTGEITCLLGASGCGKSTLLGLAAGLLTVQRGSIMLGGEVLADAQHSPPPEARPVGLVFQDGALFPHMTIAANVGFGMPRARRGEAEGWLASVDIVLRRKLRRDCRILLREAGATVVLVTHDPAEALDIADHIAVMEAGRIVQFGTPRGLHHAPQTAAVGAIFSGAQVIAGERQGDSLITAFGPWPLECVLGAVPDAGAVDLLVQADRLELVADSAGCSVRDVHLLGPVTRVLLSGAGGAPITVETTAPVNPGETYRAVPQPESVRAFKQN